MNNKGQALTEYIMIIALISVIIISIVNIFGGYIKDAFTETGCNVSGQKYVKGDAPGDGFCSSEE